MTSVIAFVCIAVFVCIVECIAACIIEYIAACIVGRIIACIIYLQRESILGPVKQLDANLL